jgi:alkanesulfonate monooxygenase SsuD/methylene tetrahydromethanopterin reductase-like flavin-dependent oxidoreductase (luciferase family)
MPEQAPLSEDSTADAAPRLRLGFFTHVEGGADLRESYANAQELFVAADELGFDSGWVAQHHFGQPDSSGLSSPWTFLANTAAKTSHVRLGTAVTILPLEHAIGLAEDVAVLDLLSGGRVELGVGSGFDPVAYGIFSQDFDQRRELTTERLRVLQRALLGRELDEGGTVLKPTAADLAETRLWQAVFSYEGAIHAAKNGSNLLLNRATYGHEEPTDVVQRPWAQAYLDNLPAWKTPRIGVSRLIFPAESKAAALAQISDGLLDGVRRLNSGERSLGPETIENALFRFHAFYGHPDEVIEGLGKELVLPAATELLAQFNPGTPTLDASIRALELLAREVAPALGWHPTDHGAAPSAPR